MDSAEKLKLALSKNEFKIKPKPGESKKDFTKRKKQAEKIDLGKLGIKETVEDLNRTTVIKGIMMPRMKEIIEMLGTELDEQGLFDEVPAGLVISGGGAETVGFTDVAKTVLRLPARVGYPDDIAGLIGEVKTPAYATSVGLLLYARKQGAGEAVRQGLDLGQVFKDLKFNKIGAKLVKLLKSLLP